VVFEPLTGTTLLIREEARPDGTLEERRGGGGEEGDKERREDNRREVTLKEGKERTEGACLQRKTLVDKSQRRRKGYRKRGEEEEEEGEEADGGEVEGEEKRECQLGFGERGEEERSYHI